MDKPLVSIIIPYYNDKKFLRQSIESVLNNNYENFELILINHKTEDECREIAHSYNDPRIKHIDLDINYGAGCGILFEKFLKQATGKYIKTMCADDILRPDGLEILVDYMETHPEKDFAFGDVEYVDANGKFLNNTWFNNRENFSFDYNEIDYIRLYLKGYSLLPYTGSIIKKSVIDNIKINRSYIMLFDMSLWLSLFCKGYKIGLIDTSVALYRIHDNQESSIKNLEAAGYRSYFEHSTFWEILFTIEDVDFVKEIFPKNPYYDKLKDVNDIPFYVSVSLFEDKKPFAYYVLEKMLQDKNIERHLIETFNFGVKEFRKLYMYPPKNKDSILKSQYKNHIYSKTPKSLSVLQLLWLLSRQVLNFIYFPHYIKKKQKSKKKKYSL